MNRTRSVRWAFVSALAFTVASAFALGGCAGPYAERRNEPVVRRFGEKLVEGPYVSPGAYEHYILAMLRESSGRPEEAVDELRRALGSDGTSAYLRVRLADALLATGRVDEAREELDAALRLEPDSGEAYIVQARLHARLGDRAGNEAALERAIALDPTLEEAYLALATIQRDSGREDRALQTVRTLAARVPSAAAEEMLGRASIKLRDRRGAREHLRRAVELDGVRNEARVELARLALGDGDADLGLSLLGTAAERTREPALSLELARATALAEHRSDALAILDRLEEEARTLPARLEVAAVFIDVGLPRRAGLIAEVVLADEKRADVRSAARAIRARAAEAEGAVGEALQSWQQLGPGDAEYAVAIRARARLLRARGKDREALALLDVAIADRASRNKLEERDQLAISLAELRAGLGDRELAITKLEELAASRPREASLRLARARLEHEAGRWPKSVALLEPAAKSGQLAAMHLLGDVLVGAHQRLDDAIRFLERAEGLAPNDAEIADSLGAAYLAAGRLDDAERLLTRADRLAPPDVDVLLHLSQLWERREQRDRAVSALRRALLAKPDERTRLSLEARLLMLENGRMGAR